MAISDLSSFEETGTILLTVNNAAMTPLSRSEQTVSIPILIKNCAHDTASSPMTFKNQYVEINQGPYLDYQLLADWTIPNAYCADYTFGLNIRSKHLATEVTYYVGGYTGQTQNVPSWITDWAVNDSTYHYSYNIVPTLVN